MASLAGCAPSNPPSSARASGGTAGTAGSSGANGGTGNSGGTDVVPSGGTSSGGTGAGGTGAGGTAGGGGGVPLPPGTEHPSLLPARIRRLTNAEYAASVKALLGVELPADISLPPDSRQDGFTRNDAQRVDPVFAIGLDQTAVAVATAARPRFNEIVPCSGAGEACAQSFIESFGERAYRRPLTDAEKSGLLTVYQAGILDAAHEDGIELVIRAVLQSAGFLYVTELGDGTASDPIVLSPHEIATSLSYLILAQPPDAALLSAASSGALDTPEGRLAEADRLLAAAGPVPPTLLRTLREWLGVDRIDQIAKDTNVYQRFDQLKPHIAAEPDAFFTQLIAESSGTVGELLSADWTVASPELAGLYGVEPASGGPGRVSLAGTTRRGILNQAAFLSVFAHAHESAPVLRGVEVLARVMCLPPESPTSLNIMVVPPVPDPNKTTRERFEIHSTDASCAGCHLAIDGVGFTFEGFDGMGAARTKEGNLDVDSSTVLAIDSPFDGAYADSAALALMLAESPEVRACFARHLFRSAAARSDLGVRPTEDAFVAEWQENALAANGNILESLRTFVTSPLFAYRRAQ